MEAGATVESLAKVLRVEEAMSVGARKAVEATAQAVEATASAVAATEESTEVAPMYMLVCACCLCVTALMRGVA